MLEGWPGEKLLVRLIDLVENGLGAAGRPWQIKRAESARIESRRRELLALAQAEIDVRDIRSGKKVLDSKGNLIEAHSQGIDPKDPLNIHEPADRLPDTLLLFNSYMRENSAQGLKQFINLSKIAVYAEEEAENFEDKENVSDEPVDPDWFSRWRTFAQDVSRDEMQRLWARVLAGEVKNPGTYSIHCMDFLARMSHSDADLISKLAQFVIDDKCIFMKSFDIFKSAGLSFEDLLYLDDIGILNGVITNSGLVTSRSIQTHNDRRFISLRCGRHALLLLTENDAIQKLDLPAYTISIVGKQILSLTSANMNIPYLQEITAYALKNGFSRAQIGEVAFTSVPGHAKVVNIRDFV